MDLSDPGTTVTCPLSAGVNTYQIYRTAGGGSQGLIASGAGPLFSTSDFGGATSGGTPPVSQRFEPGHLGRRHGYAEHTARPHQYLDRNRGLHLDLRHGTHWQRIALAADWTVGLLRRFIPAPARRGPR